jgi:hypothetical protein
MRYEVGCAGQFERRDEGAGSVVSYDDELEAFVAACDGAVGAYVVDTQTGRSFGPTCREDETEARARLMERRAARLPPGPARDTLIGGAAVMRDTRIRRA